MMKKITIIITIFIALTIKTNAQIPNNGFEDWTNMGSYYNPDLWDCFNDTTSIASVFTCERGFPGSPGSYYLKLTSKSVPGFGIVPGVAVSGKINPTTMQPESGFAYSLRSANLTGKWQHMIYGTSQGFIDVQLTRWDVPLQTRVLVASKHYNLTGMVMSWGSFSIPLTYVDGNYPDSCIITFSASGNTPAIDDYLWIDNLAFTGTAVGISELNTYSTVDIYPNPASDFVTIETKNAINEDVELTIYSTTGLLVKSEILKQNQQQINVADLSNGVYMVAIQSKDWKEIQRLIIQR